MMVDVNKLVLYDDLMQVRELLSKEANWCKGAMAKTKSGNNLLSSNLEEAYSFCMIGAIHKVARKNETLKYDRSRAMIIKILDYLHQNEIHSIQAFNDSKQTTHDQLLTMLDSVIAGLWKEIHNVK